MLPTQLTGARPFSVLQARTSEKSNGRVLGRDEVEHNNSRCFLASSGFHDKLRNQFKPIDLYNTLRGRHPGCICLLGRSPLAPLFVLFRPPASRSDSSAPATLSRTVVALSPYMCLAAALPEPRIRMARYRAGSFGFHSAHEAQR